MSQTDIHMYIHIISENRIQIGPSCVYASTRVCSCRDMHLYVDTFCPVCMLLYAYPRGLASRVVFIAYYVVYTYMHAKLTMVGSAGRWDRPSPPGISLVNIIHSVNFIFTR